MIKKNLFLKNFTHLEISKKKNLFLEKKFDRIYSEILRDKKKSSNIFYNLTKDFTFNFKIKDLNRFNKFDCCVVIGMGGSILGTEAIYQFLRYKIKYKIFTSSMI